MDPTDPDSDPQHCLDPKLFNPGSKRKKAMDLGSGSATLAGVAFGQKK
jgi:hypothetical protein